MTPMSSECARVTIEVLPVRLKTVTGVQRTEAAKLRSALYDVRRAVGCEKPYAPHEGMDPEPGR